MDRILLSAIIYFVFEINLFINSDTYYFKKNFNKIYIYVFLYSIKKIKYITINSHIHCTKSSRVVALSSSKSSYCYSYTLFDCDIFWCCWELCIEFIRPFQSTNQKSSLIREKKTLYKISLLSSIRRRRERRISNRIINISRFCLSGCVSHQFTFLNFLNSTCCFSIIKYISCVQCKLNSSNPMDVSY